MKLPYVTTSIQIRFSDLDPMGHVSNSVYTQYFDIGRMAFFQELSKKTKVPANVVASVTIDMLNEIRMSDEVTVETWCTKKGTKSITLQQNIYANGQCVTRSSIVLVGFDRETRKSIALPADWEPSEVEEG